jgi:hypothetical protein
VSAFLVPVLMVLASYRLTRLVVKDDFPPVLWIRDRLAGGWRPLTEKEWGLLRSRASLDLSKPKPWPMQTVDGTEQRFVYRWSLSPHWLAELISCPWCASAYTAGAVVAGTWRFAGLPVPVLMWLAVWGAAAYLASREDA